MWLAALTLLAGESLVIGGVWFIHPPTAAILLGVQLVALALLSGKRA